eukprot:scaffold86437_cov62-Phaeocystis_antarctica.AAC.3
MSTASRHPQRQKCDHDDAGEEKTGRDQVLNLRGVVGHVLLRSCDLDPAAVQLTPDQFLHAGQERAIPRRRGVLKVVVGDVADQRRASGGRPCVIRHGGRDGRLAMPQQMRAPGVRSWQRT